MDYLTDKLKEYSASGMLPMHMPGHKRNTGKFPWLRDLGADLDITEIEGFDNLNDPQGLFREMNGLAASLWGARESFCLVNGSTGGLLAAVKLAVTYQASLRINSIKADRIRLSPAPVHSTEAKPHALFKNKRFTYVYIRSKTFQNLSLKYAPVSKT